MVGETNTGTSAGQSMISDISHDNSLLTAAHQTWVDATNKLISAPAIQITTDMMYQSQWCKQFEWKNGP